MGPDTDSAGPRPLHAEQGHQVGRAGQDHAGFRTGPGDHALLRDRLHGDRARPSAGTRCRRSRRCHHRRRLAHVHVRRSRRVRHRRRIDRRGCRHGDGGGLVQGPRDHQVRPEGYTFAVGERQGRHPPHHRHDRRRWRSLSGDGVHGRDDRLPGHGRPHDDLQHGHRGRRQVRHHRGGRRHARVHGRAHGAPVDGVLQRPGRHVRARLRDRRLRDRAARGVPAPAEQHPPRFSGSRHPGRPGRHRQLYQRPHRGPAHRREHPEGPQGALRRAPHRHPGHAGGLPPGDARGALRHLPGRGSARLRPPTATSSAGWATRPARSTSHRRRSPPPPPSPDTSPCRTTLYREWEPR